MTMDTWVQAILAVIGAGGGVVAARSARRTKRQEKRDDFLAISTQQGAAIERLERRVQRQETEAEKQRERITDQDEAIGWLLHRVRSLVSHIKKTGMEPPPADPMSERAARYIHHIDV
jgi:shikimate kinase